MKQRDFSLKKALDPKACSVYDGSIVEQEGLEQEVYEWINQQREAEMAVFTKAITVKSLALVSNFKENNPKNNRRWVYPFMN